MLPCFQIAATNSVFTCMNLIDSAALFIELLGPWNTQTHWLTRMNYFHLTFDTFWSEQISSCLRITEISFLFKKKHAPSHKQTLSFDRETLSWTSVRVLTFLFSPWMFEHDTPCWSWCCCPTSRNVGTFFCGNNNTAAVEEVLCCPCWCACNSRRLSEMLVPPVQNVSALQGETNIW